MLKDEYELLIDETERKPNRYAAKAAFCGLPVLLVAWFLNEIGVFRVKDAPMRIAGITGILFCVLPSLIVRKEKMLTKPLTKYIIMGCIILDTLIYSITLNFHVTLILIFPMLIATQYRSTKLCYFATAGAYLCVIASTILGFLLDTWDNALLTMLLEMAESSRIILVPTVFSTQVQITKIILYLIIPKLFLLMSYGYIIYTINRGGIADLKNRLHIIRMNEMDLLTEVMNRNLYELRLPEYAQNFENTLTCVYVDADGLHELNNDKGHAAGDAMLQCIAAALREEFELEDIYRIGGDEFLVFITDTDQEEINSRTNRVSSKVSESGYHVSIGISVIKKGEDVESVVAEAEKKMYREKTRHYSESGFDRRKARN